MAPKAAPGQRDGPESSRAMEPEVSETTAVDTADAPQASDRDTSVAAESVTEPSEPSRGAPRQEGRSTKHPIPYEDHERVVDGFHQRLDALSWAARLNREQVEEAMSLYDLTRRDPRAVLEHLQSRVQQAPSPDLQDEQGRPYYSPDQAAKLARGEADRAIQGYDTKLGKRLDRLETFVSRGEAVETAQQQLTRAQSWPGFNDYIGEIADYVERANRLGQTVTLADAYIDLVVPQLSSTTRRGVMAELNEHSARTVDTINPARRASPTPESDDERPLKDLLADEFRKRERQGRGAA